MSGDCKNAFHALLVCVLLGCGTQAVAEDDELPDMEFLEYLGSWEESDEDWLMVERVGDARRDLEDEVRRDGAPEGKESSEKQDES